MLVYTCIYHTNNEFLKISYFRNEDCIYVKSCKVVIFNYVFVGFYSVPNLIVIIFNLMYLIFYADFICKGRVREKESVKTQGK